MVVRVSHNISTMAKESTGQVLWRGAETLRFGKSSGYFRGPARDPIDTPGNLVETKNFYSCRDAKPQS